MMEKIKLLRKMHDEVPCMYTIVIKKGKQKEGEREVGREEGSSPVCIQLSPKKGTKRGGREREGGEKTHSYLS